jgi:hypothetical protein
MRDDSLPILTGNSLRADGCSGNEQSSSTQKRKALAVTAIEYLELGVEQYLRELPEEEFEALAAKVRPPKESRYPAKPKRGNKSEVR